VPNHKKKGAAKYKRYAAEGRLNNNKRRKLSRIVKNNPEDKTAIAALKKLSC
jgi:hypothetical protein